MYNEVELLGAISLSFKMYKVHGARSSKKLVPLHTYIGKMMSLIWGEDFSVCYMSADNKEFKVEGKYYSKDVDIAVVKESVPVFCLGIKFVTSNYKQNSNNYFENMLGETANIQATGSLPYAQLIILRHKTPYYLKNETNTADKIEIINEANLSKYVKLVFDCKQAHRPEPLAVFLVDIDEENLRATATNIEECFSEEFCSLLGRLTVKRLFDDIQNYKRYYTSCLNGKFSKEI